MISLPIAFFSGIVSFFAPCVVPLLPVYVSYVTGISLVELKEKGYRYYRKKLLYASAFYVMGFALIFTLLGISVAGIGIFFRLYLRQIQILGGILLIIFGLEFSRTLNFAFLAKERKFKLPHFMDKNGALRSFILGVIFAFTWSPCVGPILGGILALAAVSQSAFYGGLLLFVYSIGISIPFLLVSLGLVSMPKLVSKITKRIDIISKISGYILIILGLLLVTGYYAHVNAYILEIGYKFGY